MSEMSCFVRVAFELTSVHSTRQGRQIGEVLGVERLRRLLELEVLVLNRNIRVWRSVSGQDCCWVICWCGTNLGTSVSLESVSLELVGDSLKDPTAANGEDGVGIGVVEGDQEERHSG